MNEVLPSSLESQLRLTAILGLLSDVGGVEGSALCPSCLASQALPHLALAVAALSRSRAGGEMASQPPPPPKPWETRRIPGAGSGPGTGPGPAFQWVWNLWASGLGPERGPGRRRLEPLLGKEASPAGPGERRAGLRVWHLLAVHRRGLLRGAPPASRCRCWKERQRLFICGREVGGADSLTRFELGSVARRDVGPARTRIGSKSHWESYLEPLQKSIERPKGHFYAT